MFDMDSYSSCPSATEEAPGANAHELVTDVIAALQRLAASLQTQPRDIDPSLYEHLALVEYYLSEIPYNNPRLH